MNREIIGKTLFILGMIAALTATIIGFVLGKKRIENKIHIIHVSSEYNEIINSKYMARGAYGYQIEEPNLTLQTNITYLSTKTQRSDQLFYKMIVPNKTRLVKEIGNDFLLLITEGDTTKVDFELDSNSFFTHPTNLY